MHREQLAVSFAGFKRALNILAHGGCLACRGPEHVLSQIYFRGHFDVAAESLRSEIQQVAEGLISLDRKMERQFAEVLGETRREFDEVKAMIKFSDAELAAD
jgi:hypothetical protein